jgi:hypothetical protein
MDRDAFIDLGIGIGLWLLVDPFEAALYMIRPLNQKSGASRHCVLRVTCAWPMGGICGFGATYRENRAGRNEGKIR